MNQTLAILALMAASPLSAQPRPPVEHIGAPTLNGARLPFSEVVRVGDLLFLSGQLGRKPDGTLPADFDAQARQVMDNIAAVLATARVGWGDVVKCTVMLDDGLFTADAMILRHLASRSATFVSGGAQCPRGVGQSP